MLTITITFIVELNVGILIVDPSIFTLVDPSIFTLGTPPSLCSQSVLSKFES